jgi:D-alanyl-D-alanine dipeptidase
MAEPSLLVILDWLDASEKPVLVQLPREELVRLAPLWSAPELAAN